MSKPPTSSSTMLDANGNTFEVPDFTMEQLRASIPRKCFHRSTLRGLGYVCRDIILLSINFYLAQEFITPHYIPLKPLRFLLWSLYGFTNGLFGTGLWVLAHECGHQAFSPSAAVNDIVGFILHSALLVPYYSWKISHRKHHQNTAHMERDMVFVPRTRSQYAQRFHENINELSELTADTPIYTLSLLLARQLVGWPIYLIANDTGHNFHDRQHESRGLGKKNGFLNGVNHFNPNSPLFEKKDSHYILLSDIGIAITASVLFLLASRYGWQNLAVWYFLPYLWVNHWLVLITYLQHTDPSLPHYTSKSWTYVRGAASTIDRDFGFIGQFLFHGIIETHVLHHFFATIPFYNAYEASEAIRPIMGRHYRSDTKGGPLGLARAVWRNLRCCQWVERSKNANGAEREVLFYRNRNKIGEQPMRIGE